MATKTGQNGTYWYPSFLENQQERNGSAYLKIKAYQYTLPTIEERKGEAGNEDYNVKVSQKIEKEDQLFEFNTYVPGGFGESSSFTWENANVAWQADPTKMKKQFLDVWNSDGSGITDVLGSEGVVKSGAAYFGNQVGIKAMSKMGGFAEQLSATLGVTISPNISKVFRGGGDRALPLTISFIPESKQEAKAVSDVIEEFRMASVPLLTKGASLGVINIFEYPALFDITVMFDNQPIKTGSFVEYKSMACTGFNVRHSNETPVFSHSRDGYATDSILDLSFVSLFPIYREE